MRRLSMTKDGRRRRRRGERKTSLGRVFGTRASSEGFWSV
jgi:hypothetical protein